MDWILPVLLAWGLLVGPGWLVLASARARLPLRWAYGPAITCALFFVLTAAYNLVDVRWSPISMGIGSALVAALVGVVRQVTQNRTGKGRTGEGDDHPPGAAVARAGRGIVAVGAGLGALLLVIPASVGMGSISVHNGSYDAFFHHSAIAFIRESGDAFPLTALAPLYGGEATFYPATWHSIAALLPYGTVASANATVLATLAIVPSSLAGMLLMIAPRSIGRSSRSLVIGALAAASSLFLTIPTMGLHMGLWPYVLGLSLLPLALGSTWYLARRFTRRGHAVPRGGEAIALSIIAGTVIAHPTMIFTVAVFVVAGWLICSVRAVAGRPTRIRGVVSLLLLLAGFVAYALVIVPRISSMDLTDPPPNTVLSTLLVLLADRPPVNAIPFQPLFMIPILVLAGVGVWAAFRQRSIVLVVAGTTALIAVVMTFSTHAPPGLFSPLTSPWYGARERVAPIFQLSIMVLAAGGGFALIARGERSARPWMARAVAVGLVVILIGTSVLAAFSRDRLQLVGSLAYTAYGKALWPYLAPEEREFIEEQAAMLPPDSVVLGVPRDGTPAFWFLEGVDVVLPSLAPPQSVDAGRVATYGYTIGPDTDACHSAKRLGITHLYEDESRFSADELAPEIVEYFYLGIRDFPDEYLSEIARDGDYVLYAVRLPC